MHLFNAPKPLDWCFGGTNILCKKKEFQYYMQENIQLKYSFEILTFYLRTIHK
jgi:hypothetical protein